MLCHRQEICSLLLQQQRDKSKKKKKKKESKPEDEVPWCESWEYSGSESLVEQPETSVRDSQMSGWRRVWVVELEWPSRTAPPPSNPPRGTHKQSNSRLNELAAAIVRSDYECFRAHSIRRRSRCQDGFVLAGRSRCSLAGGLTVLCQFATSLAILSVKKNKMSCCMFYVTTSKSLVGQMANWGGGEVPYDRLTVVEKHKDKLRISVRYSYQWKTAVTQCKKMKPDDPLPHVRDEQDVFQLLSCCSVLLDSVTSAYMADQKELWRRVFFQRFKPFNTNIKTLYSFILNTQPVFIFCVGPSGVVEKLLLQ